VAWHPVYVPWFHRAISKSLKRNVRPLSRFVWLRCMTFRLVKSLSLAHQSSRHRKDTRNKALGSKGRTISIADAPRDDEKRFVVHVDEKADGVFELESAIRAFGELL